MTQTSLIPVLIALGSNLGDPAAQIGAAMTRLQSLSERPILRSSLWRSSPVDCPPGSPDFLNAAALLRVRTSSSPEELLARLKRIELEFGRTAKKIQNEARPLDLDLILFGNEIRQTPRLILPHPRGHERAFVLAPAAEVAAEIVWPGQNATTGELLGRLGKVEGLERI